MVEVICSIALEVIFARKTNKGRAQVVIVTNDLGKSFRCDLICLALDEQQRQKSLAVWAVADDVETAGSTSELHLASHQVFWVAKAL